MVKRVRAHRVPANTITVDGRLNEEAWADAMPAGDFNTGSNARRLSFTGAWRFGGYYSGTRDGVTAGGRVRINEKLASTLSVTSDTVALPDGISYRTTLASLRVDASFSTRMFLNGFVQYNSVTRQVSSNIRFDFIHRPLSDIYLVLNDTHVVDFAVPVAIDTRAGIIKVTHLFSF